MKFDRGKYGDSGGGGGGKKSGSGKGNSSSGDGLEISDAGGLPEGNHKAITNAEGGAISIEVGSGHPNEESSDDGGTMNQAHGTGHSVGGYSDFVSVVIHVTLDLSAQNTDYISPTVTTLPQNNTKPGGEVVEVTIILNANNSVIQVQGIIWENCSDLTVSDLILFDSTNNLRLGTVIQFFRGDCVATLLWGNDSAKEISDSTNPVPIPRPPPSINMSTWGCLGYTTGESVPFMNPVSSITLTTVVLGGPCVFFFLFVLLFLWCSSLNRRRRSARSLRDCD